MTRYDHAMSTVAAYAGVARAPFLLLPPTLIAAGAAASYFEGGFSWLRTLVATVGLVSLHMAVNIFNEWSDMRSGIDLHTERTPFSGGSGTLPAGGLSLRATFVFGCCCSAVGLLAGIWFFLKIGLPLLPVLVFGAVTVLAYTDLLARLGVGEFAAGLGLGALPVIGAALVQDGQLGPAAWSAALPAFFMTFNLLLLNEFPDEQADRRGGRRNLVLILGRRAAALVYVVAGLAAPLWIIAAVLLQLLPTWCYLAAVPSLLLLAPLRWAFGHTAEAVPHSALGANVAWNLTGNIVMTLCLVLATTV